MKNLLAPTVFFVVTLVGVAVGCSDDPLLLATGTSSGGPDGSTSDSDGAPPPDGGDAGSGGPGDAAADSTQNDTYNDMTSSTFWSSFDLAALVDPDAGDGGVPLREFQGATFDGRYLYFAPYYNGTYDGIVVRHDTQSSFTASSSWSSFDVATTNPGARGFFGAAFDGKNVYFVPWSNPAKNGIVTRYDTTQMAFATAGSWTTFDTASIDAHAVGFVGAVFDGRYLYFAPNNDGINYPGLVTRYDTQASFGSSGSWSTFDLTGVGSGSASYWGGVFDGRYVYFVPHAAGSPSSPTANGKVVRYDTEATFATSGSWSTFDATTVDPVAKGFAGGAFDGRYVYFVPNATEYSPGIFDGLAARYDTKAAFDASSSWSTFDVSMADARAKGFMGAAFDGRYVYFLPWDNGSGLNGVVTRYDTTASFSAATSWSFFDMTTVNPGAKAYRSAVFNGRYVYFVPAQGSVVTRFEARSTTAMPALPSFSGSFL